MNETQKLTQDDIPNIPQNADGLIVRLSALHRKQILGTDNGEKKFVASVAHAHGTNLIFIVGLEESMPNNEVTREIKKHGLMFALVVTEKDVLSLENEEIECLSYNIVNTRNNNQVAFLVEIRREEDKK